MRIHHLDCTTMCPLGGHLMDGETRSLGHAKLVCHCLLLETDRNGLVLVDTGFGLRDFRRPDTRLSRVFMELLKPDLHDESRTAVRQVEGLGFSARDVRHVVLTHLDFDHAGGLDDFPEARVHLLEREREVAELQRTWLDRQRFRPSQWESRARWQTYVPIGEPWHGFECVRPVTGLPDDVLLVPLAGHTLGHAGVAVRLDGTWLLHCGDAYFHHLEMEGAHHRCPLGLRAYQTLMEQDRSLRLANQRRLRNLVREHDDVRVFCAHDRVELQRLQSVSARADREELRTEELGARSAGLEARRP